MQGNAHGDSQEANTAPLSEAPHNASLIPHTQQHTDLQMGCPPMPVHSSTQLQATQCMQLHMLYMVYTTTWYYTEIMEVLQYRCLV